ncbi:MAG: acetyl-CoA carboxylase carboxyltransferase subunit alpha [Spirochaetia bacterium]|nr:acetyl-CoA carboxylase carboxyltransferase subunit alpha [Spirochaetia bacterium]
MNEQDKNPQKDQIDKLFGELEQLAQQQQMDLGSDLSTLKAKMVPVLKNRETTACSPWDKVCLARHVQRPGSLEYINMMCDDFMELHGDRCYGDDTALIGGIGTIDGRAITFIGNQKGSNLKENIARNHGMGHPEGYRKALRLVQQAEKFNRPVVSFIDTSGAYPGLASEERGIGEAIARNLKEFSVLKVPVLCFIIGEGGSGGALGIGVGDKLYMLENAVYSVISPEGFASILLRDSSKAEEAANTMKITAEDLKEFGIIHDIIPEPVGGAHKDPQLVASHIKKIITRDLDILCSKPADRLVRYRIKKIRGIGHFNGAQSWWDQLLNIFQLTRALK